MSDYAFRPFNFDQGETAYHVVDGHSLRSVDQAPTRPLAERLVDKHDRRSGMAKHFVKRMTYHDQN